MARKLKIHCSVHVANICYQQSYLWIALYEPATVCDGDSPSSQRVDSLPKKPKRERQSQDETDFTMLDVFTSLIGCIHDVQTDAPTFNEETLSIPRLARGTRFHHFDLRFDRAIVERTEEAILIAQFVHRHTCKSRTKNHPAYT